jgi:hypothetical protein
MSEPVKEICICAAVRRANKVWRGNRHFHALQAMKDELSWMMSRKEISESDVQVEQGFVTSDNRFVDRIEGLALQKAAGVNSSQENGYGNELFSEDLY